MNTPTYYGERGRVQQSTSHLPKGYPRRTVLEAISALTPGMYRAGHECHAVYGAGYHAVLANMLGPVSFAAAGNYRIRDRDGLSMSLGLQIWLAAAPLSGKSKAHSRFNAPVVAAMKGWNKRWLFSNVTLAALLRRIRGRCIWLLLSTSEARGYLRSSLSHSFQDVSDLYDGNVSSFDRADDKEDIGEPPPDSAVFVMCLNAQDDALCDWLDENGKEAVASGYLFRVLMIKTDELANEGAGARQRESALLDYDQRIDELVASAQEKLETMSASQLPVIEVSSAAEHILRQGQREFEYMANAVLSPRLATVFAVRLAANARRIAGCMHVFESYEGAVSADTMDRAVTIAEFFGAQWLATVFPPKPIPDDIQRAQRLLDFLQDLARRSPQASWRKRYIEDQAPNFGWTKAQMSEAIRLICGHGFAEAVPRMENGRSVMKLELRLYSFGNRLLYPD